MNKKKYLQKNEIRVDNNPKHFNKNGKPHIAYITARYGHKYYANTRTHSEYVHGEKTYLLDKKTNTRISPPFWQNENQFSQEKFGKIPKKYKSKISRFNRKYRKRTRSK